MNIEKIVTENFEQSIATKQQTMNTLVPLISKAGVLIAEAFAKNNKLLICGNGGSAADAQHLAAEFTGRYEMERRPLPAIALTTDTSALTAIGNDYSFDVIFSKQVEALGNQGDVLYAISTSGNSANVIKAIEVAKSRGMKIVALVGKDGGKIAKILDNEDVCVCVEVNRTARIQEVHLLALHSICEIVDTILFKS